MVKVDIEIQNIVLTVTYKDTEFDLEELAGILKGARYEPEVFPGVIYKSKTPRASFLIFASGKMNCVGAKSMKDAEKAIKELTNKLKNSGVKIKGKPKIKVRNMVASLNFHREFDVEQIAREFPNTEYEPEVFPGLVLRLDEPKVVILLFVSGKGVCVGAESITDIKKAAKKITKVISK
ncbi:hypothetical protein AKJ35_01095 [candidate division MSBL1 archaeon SCGC-AAA833F18]|uniref:TATA-box-binding protein n=2 Tax=candidate division MSBL1 TaxID=215777 RepID=A0A133VT23_9EURY|nr:hypothetical protein AKJ35_01095 [candidate division MSBL1 archaeon SCGC-AAA833F18]KXB09583.1 hypothetical protein AKJ46_00095 [candidate division MSBL1 archaeon SCGC-AAA833K04]